ncbi:hypothetical protein PTKIN_Ptkin11bG0098100 [Pterospermum kingtungense]
MVQYNFRNISVVPKGKDLIDRILSHTQRQTPTLVHKGYAISRLRQFYMRKVKYTQQNIHHKLSTIIDEFPRLDDIHPFYGDLLHVLYNKDHYKLALGQINTARNLISKIAKDYVKLLKYGDSLYRCKSLKIAALGRMSDVDVQPYAFSTKSLFVGHTEYEGHSYQVIDTPGILDRPFLDRNIIEMCSITALAHLQAAVLFFLDISGSCGYGIAQQAALFHSIKSPFMGKPLIIVCNKTDLQPLDGLSEEDIKLVMEMKAEAMKTVMVQGGEPSNEEESLLTMSTLTREGVIAVKNAACERILNQRVEFKMESKKINYCDNSLHVAIPKPRDKKGRPPCIPQAVLEAKAKQASKQEKRKTQKDLENENGGAGVYSANLRKKYILANDEWKEDILPEILDGHNVYDFMDPDILPRLEELEENEGLRRAVEEDIEFEMDGNELSPEEQEAQAAIRKKKKRMGRQLSNMGLDPSLARSRGQKRERSLDDDGGEAIDMDVVDRPNKKLRSLSMARSRSGSRPPSEVVPGEGLKDSAQKVKAHKLSRKSVKKRNKYACCGEADRVIPTLKPKHLFSGKRSIGKLKGVRQLKCALAVFEMKIVSMSFFKSTIEAFCLKMRITRLFFGNVLCV